MELISKADVVLALGTRLNPFSTLPGYGIDYWPQAARLIQVDINADRIASPNGLRSPFREMPGGLHSNCLSSWRQVPETPAARTGLPRLPAAKPRGPKNLPL